MTTEGANFAIQKSPSKLWTTREVAALLAVTPRTIVNWVRDGRLGAMRTTKRGHLRFTIEHINKYLKSMPEVKARIRAGKPPSRKSKGTGRAKSQ